MNRRFLNTEKTPFAERFWIYGLACMLAALCLSGTGLHAQQSSAGDAAIPGTQLLRPAELARILRSPGSEKPLILQVGSHILFAEAHIPGSEYAGPAAQQSGLQALRERVHKLSRSQFLVIYCGCCPWTKCPNIRPAYQQLTAQGFTHVRVLYLEQDFGTDWVAKGYPVAKGR